MFSGKSEELIRRLRRAKIGGRKVLLMRPPIDDRYSKDILISHGGQQFEAVQHLLLASFPMHLEKPWDGAVIGVDEAQFYDRHLIRDIHNAIEDGITIIAAGLDMNYLREPFGVMPTLMAIADTVDKLSAVCSCGADAIYTYRAHGGTDEIEIGGLDAYEARCRECYERVS